jgi:hypothetical protein
MTNAKYGKLLGSFADIMAGIGTGEERIRVQRQNALEGDRCITWILLGDVLNSYVHLAGLYRHGFFWAKREYCEVFQNPTPFFPPG